MKIWKYYKVPDKENRDNEKKKYDLYAITDKRRYAERFENERNMNMFIKGEVSDLDDSDGLDFLNANQQLVLDVFSYETKAVKELNKQYTIDTVALLTTYSEYFNCKSEQCEEFMFTETMFIGVPHYKIFNNKLIKDLKRIEYVNLFKVLVSNPIFINSMSSEDIDYAAPDICADEFGVFLRCYGSLFK